MADLENDLTFYDVKHLFYDVFCSIKVFVSLRRTSQFVFVAVERGYCHKALP